VSGLGRGLVVLAGVVAIGAIAGGLWVMGSPAAQRAAALDERRTQDLARIARQIDRWWMRETALPADLATVAAQPGLRLAVVDPLDGRPYDYAPTGADRYRVCAVFATDTGEDPLARRGGRDDDWLHPVGPHCFERVVDKD
jgi:hypothetical protein